MRFPHHVVLSRACMNTKTYNFLEQADHFYSIILTEVDSVADNTWIHSVLTYITGKAIEEEATISTATFNLLMWIRCRRQKDAMAWSYNCILRMNGKRMIERLLFEYITISHARKSTVGRHVNNGPSEWSWFQLQKMAVDRIVWGKRVQALKTTTVYQQ